MNIVLTFHGSLEDLNSSGAPRTLLELAHRYCEEGHAARVLTFDDMPRHLPPRARVALFPLFLAKRCRALALEEGIDVIDGAAGDTWLSRRPCRQAGGRSSSTAATAASSFTTRNGSARSDSAGSR